MKILCRYSSDLVIKSAKIRARFVSRLIQNIESAFAAAGIQAEIERQWSRLFIETDNPAALTVLGQIYGISSYSPIDRECEATMEAIVATGAAAYKDLVKGKTFAVRARRRGTDYPFNSLELAKTLGAALWEESAGVKLRNPEVEVSVEVRLDRAYLYSQSFRGPMGLPLGVSGHGICLLSGGFDSAVAAWYMQKRGIKLDYVFCNLAGGAYERSVLQVARLMATTWSHGARPYLHVVDFQPLVAELRKKVKASHVQVILKRLFYRTAERIAAEVKAEAIITGECIAQVSSQTLRNLIAIERVVEMPVLRPLAGFDKEEIMAVARRIGTYALCSGVEEYCQLVPDKPVTACRPEKADFEESRVDPALLDEALKMRRIIKLKELVDADLATPYLYVEEIPDGAVVVDCRERELYDAWHHPGALNIELHELLTDFRRLDKSATYVLYCPVGLQSAVAAEAMQKKGYQAYSYQGGMRRLVQEAQ